MILDRAKPAPPRRSVRPCVGPIAPISCTSALRVFGIIFPPTMNETWLRTDNTGTMAPRDADAVDQLIGTERSSRHASPGSGRVPLRRVKGGVSARKGIGSLLWLFVVLLLIWAFYVLYAAPWLVELLSPVHDFPY